MRNIPTELLRTLVAVVDQRGFTKAAMALGVSQPAVSTQVKRLQFLLGIELFDRRTQGVSLTEQGEIVVDHARRLLAINDQIVELERSGRCARRVVRIGAPGDFFASAVSRHLAQAYGYSPSLQFHMRMDAYEALVRDLRHGNLDLVLGLTATDPVGARHWWREGMAWARGNSTRIDVQRPIPLVSYSEKSLSRFVAAMALKGAGLELEDVLFCPSYLGVSSAVAAGLGVTAMARRRISTFGLMTWDDGPLPALQEIYCAIYVREGERNESLEELADSLADVLRPDGKSGVDLKDAFMPSKREVTSAA